MHSFWHFEHISALITFGLHSNFQSWHVRSHSSFGPQLFLFVRRKNVENVTFWQVSLNECIKLQEEESEARGSHCPACANNRQLLANFTKEKIRHDILQKLGLKEAPQVSKEDLPDHLLDQIMFKIQREESLEVRPSGEETEELFQVEMINVMAKNGKYAVLYLIRWSFNVIGNQYNFSGNLILFIAQWSICTLNVHLENINHWLNWSKIFQFRIVLLYFVYK